MDDPAVNALRRHMEVDSEAEALIGERAWALLSGYGKVMDGAHAGSYVSGVPFALQLDLVHRLSRGETVPVHLMHRHVSGHYEISWVRWSQDGLVMVYRDREEPA